MHFYKTLTLWFFSPNFQKIFEIFYNLKKKNKTVFVMNCLNCLPDLGVIIKCISLRKLSPSKSQCNCIVRCKFISFFFVERSNTRPLNYIINIIYTENYRYIFFVASSYKEVETVRSDLNLTLDLTRLLTPSDIYE